MVRIEAFDKIFFPKREVTPAVVCVHHSEPTLGRKLGSEQGTDTQNGWEGHNF